ncbi:hypothetical protein SSP531S_24680 [Streptomyces spongiicola]|uniref:Uncharacterized protein n=1 Tax=Streptomyces spongiicola TaxID=1690221 RepID=A0A388SWL6_9ACTN|nr:DUF6303 family protein [Streptomyces spongiicola]GBQ01038.1 hypothetical protein SSP531S_24680 [Streptomyces spongiicola]
MSSPEQVRAVLDWTAPGTGGDVGGWCLRIAPSVRELSPVSFVWPPHVTFPPTLMERYDALASLGFAVVEGGAGAWEWHEGTWEDGSVVLMAYTAVRPLTAHDLSAQEAAGVPYA